MVEHLEGVPDESPRRRPRRQGPRPRPVNSTGSFFVVVAAVWLFIGLLILSGGGLGTLIWWQRHVDHQLEECQLQELREEPERRMLEIELRGERERLRLELEP
jgi:hypothetical protein